MIIVYFIVIFNGYIYHSYIHIISKLNSRLYCLRKVKRFNVNICILKLFYQLVINSVFTYCCVCWGGSITKRDINRITGIIKNPVL